MQGIPAPTKKHNNIYGSDRAHYHDTLLLTIFVKSIELTGQGVVRLR